MEMPEIFYTYEWALAVSHAYRDSITPLLILAYERDSLVGVVALATDNARPEVFFLASATADYCDFVSSPVRRANFVDLVFAQLRKLNIPVLVATNLPADSATSHALTVGTRAHGYITFSRQASLCGQISMQSSVERRKLRDIVVSRKALRYSFRGLGKRGPVTIDHLKSQDSLRAALPEFVKAHIARFSASGRQSNLAHPQRQAFLAE